MVKFEAGVMSSVWYIESECVDSGVARLRLENQITAPIAIYTEGLSSDLCSSEVHPTEKFLMNPENHPKIRSAKISQKKL